MFLNKKERMLLVLKIHLKNLIHNCYKTLYLFKENVSDYRWSITSSTKQKMLITLLFVLCIRKLNALSVLFSSVASPFFISFIIANNKLRDVLSLFLLFFCYIVFSILFFILFVNFYYYIFNIWIYNGH